MNVRLFDLLGEPQAYVAKFYIGQDQFLAWNLTIKETINENIAIAGSTVCTPTSAHVSIPGCCCFFRKFGIHFQREPKTAQ